MNLTFWEKNSTQTLRQSENSHDALCVGSNFSWEISEPCAPGSREIMNDSHRCSVKDHIILCHVIQKYHVISCHILRCVRPPAGVFNSRVSFTSSPWSNSPGMDSLSAVEFRNRFTGKMPGPISFDGGPSARLGELGMNHCHPVPSGKRWHDGVKSQISMDKSTINGPFQSINPL